MYPPATKCSNCDQKSLSKVVKRWSFSILFFSQVRACFEEIPVNKTHRVFLIFNITFFAAAQRSKVIMLKT
ncbi:hypothetical protein BGS_0659 [Beggiatoa sp. SS]|nr:hypothetical protein BGS_0659 [Beggiatoa sp. SS]